MNLYYVDIDGPNKYGLWFSLAGVRLHVKTHGGPAVYEGAKVLRPCDNSFCRVIHFDGEKVVLKK